LGTNTIRKRKYGLKKPLNPIRGQPRGEASVLITGGMMRIILDKLLDLANLILTGYLIACLFKPDITFFWTIIFPVAAGLYLYAVVYIALEKPVKRRYLRRKK
jgi:hypothetical protein